MTTSITKPNRRILVVDDNVSIHGDFRKILGAPDAADAALDAAEARLLGAPQTQAFEIDTASQGKEGLQLVERSMAEDRPYALAFVDVRMPPGWDGLETTKRIWQICPDLQIVICTAFADCQWEEVLKEIKPMDRLLILKKPFDSIEVLQIASALSEKWRLRQESKSKLDDLEQMVELRTREIEESRLAAFNMMADAVAARKVAEAANRDLQQEMTARKQVEESHTRLATAVEQAAEAVMITDANATILYVNPAFETTSGYTREEAIGQNPRILKSGKQDAEFYRRMWAVLTAGDVWSGHMINKRKDGTLYEEDSTISPVRDAAGQIVNFVAVKRDVTEQNKLESQMLRAQRLESIGTLAGGVAHDLNNALAPILMAVELLRMKYPDGTKLIDTVESSARRGADMVKQLLTFAKGVEGERILVQPKHLLKEMQGIIKGTFPKNIQLRTDHAQNLQLILGDATQLHQVLLNLCVNARDAMPHGGTLTLEAENVEIDATFASAVPEAKPGHYVVWRVKDTGTGISPEIQERIFEPFFSTKGPDKGTGLGLSTLIGIVKSHGGFIQVYSKPGKGTSFTVYLPASEANAPALALVEQADKGFRGNGEKILVVDDEPNVRQITRDVLTELNFKVLVAADGTQALIQVADHRADLCAVITDLRMPHMDGLTFVRVLRSMLPEAGIIVASGRLDEVEADDFKALDVNTLLNKPFNREKLVEALKEVLQK